MTQNALEQTPRHVSVLLRECIDNLNIRPDGIYLDGTLGMGGHSYEIASRLSTGRLVGIDRDATAIERAGRRLAPFAERVTLVHGNFADAAAILDSLGIGSVDGMLFDLGVSSPQLDEAGRGFSYMEDARLDMRMDAGAGLSAYEVVNSWDESRLNRILWAVSAMMDTAPDKLKKGGRLCVISFHSLEDRIVKNAIQARENGCTCPREAPVCTCGFVRTLRSVSRKPIVPGPEELAANPRARSAKLRVAERV